MERPTLRQLEYAVAVADHLSFRRAAEACFVSQPGLSTQVRQLEENLGVQLFERDRRSVLVTPAGGALVARMRALLGDTDGLLEAARVSREPLAGDLRLGVIPTVAPYALPSVMSAARRRYPRLRFLLREDQTARLVERMKAGELDLLLLALEADLDDLETTPLYRDPFVLAVPESHRLARRKRVRESDLSGEEVLLLDDGHCLRDQALSICGLAGAKEVGDFRATSLNTLIRMVASGVGVTLLPAMSIDAEVRTLDRITRLPLSGAAPARTIGLAWRASSARAAEYEALIELFAEHAPGGTTPA